MARDAAAWLDTQAAARAHRHDQGPLRRLHDDHAQPLERADARRGALSRRARSVCSTRPRPGTRPVRLLGVSVHNFRSDSDVDEAPNRLPFEDRGHGHDE